MKTPREILLERHRAAQAKLDAVRRETLNQLNTEPPERSPASWREWLRPLRWHLAGLSVVWLFILLLRADAGQSSVTTASLAKAKMPPQVVMAALQENRRQLVEMLESPPADADHRDVFQPKPHSERRVEMLTA